MELLINTTETKKIIISLKDLPNNFSVQKTITANYQQAEKLLVSIDKLLNKYNKKLADLNKIIVKNGQGSFTSLRIGIVTANTLSYLLNIPVEDNNQHSKKIKKINLVIPEYTQEPNITQAKTK